MKIYIAGKITGNPDYKQQFAEAEKKLRKKGHMRCGILPGQLAGQHRSKDGA